MVESLVSASGHVTEITRTVCFDRACCTKKCADSLPVPGAPRVHRGGRVRHGAPLEGEAQERHACGVLVGRARPRGGLCGRCGGLHTSLRRKLPRCAIFNFSKFQISKHPNLKLLFCWLRFSVCSLPGTLYK